MSLHISQRQWLPVQLSMPRMGYGLPVRIMSVADVWSIFDFLMPGYLGDYETFKADFEEPIADGGAAGEEHGGRLACLRLDDLREFYSEEPGV